MGLADVAAVSEVHVAAWQTTYRGLLPEEYLDRLTPGDFAERWSRSLSTGTRSTVDIVGLDPGGSVVGLGTAGPSRDPDPPTAWELWGLNVSVSAQGTGLADLMMEHLVGARSCSLWVLKGNDRAMSFYRRYAFELDQHVRPHGTTEAIEQRMVRT